MATIAPSGEEAIRRDEVCVEPAPPIADTASLVDIYDVKETTAWILEHQHRIVGLQFPDELLPHSIPVLQALRRALASEVVGASGKSRAAAEVELYIMADTTYGSCCVDEVAAQHVSADAVVHYGNACLSSPSRLAVYYVFPKRSLQTSTPKTIATAIRVALDKFKDHNVEKAQSFTDIRLCHDLCYNWTIEEIWRALRDQLDVPLLLNRVDRSANDPSSRSAGRPHVAFAAEQVQTCISGQLSNDTPAGEAATSSSPPSSLSTSAFIYLGPPSRRLTHLVLVHSHAPVWALDPDSEHVEAILQTTQTNRLLMRRYGTIQRARDADTVGIVVGTLGVAGYLPVLAHLRAILRQYGKKSYTVAVGKLRPEKLSNFAEVECWVLVACPENALLDGIGAGTPESKAYPVPVVTPFELEVALDSAVAEHSGNGKRRWDGTYILDFRDLLRSSASRPDIRNQELDTHSDGPVFSTATGKYRTRKTWEAGTVGEAKGQKSLSIRDSHAALATSMGSSAGVFLAGRSYRGLDPQTGQGQGPPALVETGRSGIARDYGEGDH